MSAAPKPLNLELFQNRHVALASLYRSGNEKRILSYIPDITISYSKLHKRGKSMTKVFPATGEDPAHVELAHAKLNLGLKVLGARGDGFHDILSVFQSIDLADRLLFHPSTVAGFSCSEPSLPTTEDNLVLKAQSRFSKAVPEAEALLPTLHLHLEKSIPVGAGLGGATEEDDDEDYDSAEQANQMHDVNPYYE